MTRASRHYGSIGLSPRKSVSRALIEVRMDFVISEAAFAVTWQGHSDLDTSVHLISMFSNHRSQCIDLS